MTRESTVSRLPGSGVHLPALDGVRGIAIMLVLVHHFALYSGIRTSTAGLVDRAVFRVATMGWSGVDLFFVLSGFLITGILYGTKSDEGYFRNFYMRRVLRVFPLYYGTLFVYFFVAPQLIRMGDRFAAVAEDQLWFWTYLINIKIAISGWPAQLDLGHFWSLAIEEQFYMVWPLVVFLANRKTLMRICVFCIALALVLRLALYFWAPGAVEAPYALAPTRLDALAIGALIAVWARGPEGLSVLVPWIRPAIVVPGVLLGALFLWQRRLAYTDVPLRTVGYTVIAVFFGGVLALAAVQPRESRWGRFFAHPTLRFMGKYSYGLYVIHHIVIADLGRRGFQTTVLPTLWGSQLPGLVIFSLVAGSISMVLALLSWYLWESQFLKLKRYFAYRSRDERAAPQGGAGEDGGIARDTRSPSMSRDADPSVTAILLSYNAEPFIAEALASVLAQDCEPMEVIVSDDASTDGTYGILRREVARYRGPHRIALQQRTRNTGSKSAHLNHVFPIAKGDILVSFDADDVSEPSRVRRTLQAFGRDPAVKAVYSSLSLIDGTGRALGRGNVSHPPAGEPARRWFARVDANAAGGTLAIRREVAEAFGPMEPDIVEDIVLPFRASLLGKVVYLDEPLIRARRHARSLTADFASLESLEGYRDRMQLGIARARRNLDSRFADIEAAEQGLGLAAAEARELRTIAQRSVNDAERTAQLMSTSLPRRLSTLFWLISSGAYRDQLGQHAALALMPRTYLRYKRRKLGVSRAVVGADAS